MKGSINLEATLRHDRALVLTAQLGIAVQAWCYMLHEAHGMAYTGVCE